MKIINNVKSMQWDWSGWLMGILGAVISGTSIGLLSFTIGVNWHKSLILFAGAVAVSLGKFLQQHNIPDPILPKGENS